MTEITNPDGNKEKEEKGASFTLAKGLCKKPHLERPLENGCHFYIGGNSFQRPKHCYRESDFWVPNRLFNQRNPECPNPARLVIL